MRRLLIILACLACLLALAIALAPWWLGTALRHAAGGADIHFKRYERVGYARFRLVDVVAERPGWTARIESVAAPGPLPWLFDRLRGREPEVRIDGWSVTQTAGAAIPQQAGQQARAGGWTEMADRLRHAIAVAGPWLPSIDAREGLVHWKDRRIDVAHAEWRGRRLKVEGAAASLGGFAATAEPTSDLGQVKVHLNAWDGKISSDVTLDRGSIGARVMVLGNSAKLKARFGAEGWLPSEAHVEARDWTIDATVFRLGEWYGKLDGGFSLSWKHGGFDADLHVNAAPKARNVPPLSIVANGSGTPARFQLSKLEASAPWMQAHLAEPVAVDRHGRLESGESKFTFASDLARQPWFRGSGRLEGIARVIPQANQVPTISFEVKGTALSVRRFAVESVEAKGALTWPVLELSLARIAPGPGESVDAAGRVDFRSRSVAEARATFHLADSAAKLIPASAGIAFESMKGDVSVSGPWAALKHSGKVEALAVKRRPVKPVDLLVNWRGSGTRVDSAEVTARRGATRIEAAGSATATEVRVESLRILSGEAQRWHLEGTATVGWSPRVTVSGATLTGGAGTISADYAPEAGSVAVALKDPDFAWVSDFIEWKQPPALTIHAVDLSGRWTDGNPAEFKVAATASVALPNDRTVAATAAARSEGAAVILEHAEASDGQRSFVHASGRLPVSIHPGRTPFLEVDSKEKISLMLDTEPYEEFWDRLAGMTGISLTNPSGHVTLEGTLESPTGEATIRADAVSASKGIFPTVRDLDLKLTAAEDTASLEHLRLTVDGQAAQITGRLPLGRDAWRRLVQNPAAFDWRQAELKLHIGGARLAPFARYLPRFLAPQGRLAADVQFHSGGELGGHLQISGAASRPLGSLGALQDVSAEVSFSGRRATFQRIAATIGGEPLDVRGWVELPAKGAPRLNVSLRASSVPVARQPGLVVRSDLDLKAVTPESGPTVLSGSLQLRDSFYVTSLGSMMPGGKQAGPARRPPYFSIEQAPFGEWKLDVKIAGDRFMRVRTPLFRGTVSARFRLTGSLADPLALGEATINDGDVLFPFAAFNVTDGRVSLASDHPHEPKLQVSGEAHRYGYDLRMELTGTAAQPNLTFSSRPALTSEQVLLLVMAGEPPKSDAQFSNQQRFAQLGAYLGRNLFTTFGGDPTASSRLTVTTGEQLSHEGQETLEVEYELNKQLSLVGEYDEYDEYNVGIKWRVLRRKNDEEK